MKAAAIEVHDVGGGQGGVCGEEDLAGAFRRIVEHEPDVSLQSHGVGNQRVAGAVQERGLDPLLYSNNAEIAFILPTINNLIAKNRHIASSAIIILLLFHPTR